MNWFAYGYNWYKSLSKKTRDSINIALFIVGFFSTVCTIVGFSMANITVFNVWTRLAIAICTFAVIYILTYKIIDSLFKEKIELFINNTSVEVARGDIFQAEGYKVIGCDTQFHTTVDDVIISKSSLHGQLILKHGKVEEIIEIVKKEAAKLNIEADEKGLFDFPLGTIIRYDSSIDNNTYLLLAMSELNTNFESHTNMERYEHMLMKMWSEINRVYASNNIVLPILGDGITRFEGSPKDRYRLIRCILCTLNSSGKSFNSKITILFNGKTDDIPLYELTDIVKTIGRG